MQVQARCQQARSLVRHPQLIVLCPNHQCGVHYLKMQTVRRRQVQNRPQRDVQRQNQIDLATTRQM